MPESRRPQVDLDGLRAEIDMLRQSMLDLEVTIQSIGDGVIVTDEQTMVTRMNPVAEELTGWTIEQARGVPLDEVFCILHGDTGRPVENPAHKVVSTGEVQGLGNNTILVSRSGRKLQIADSAAPIYDRHNRLLGVVLVFRDVSEEYRKQAAIAASETRFRTLADASPMAILLYQDDRWIYVNPSTETMTGYSRQELMEMNFWTIVHPDHQDVVKKIGRARQAGEDPRGLFQLKIITREGQVKWVHLSGVTTLIDGRPAGIIAVTDITALKETEESLRRSEERYRSIVENIQEGYFELDLAGNFTFVNPALCRMVGGRPEEVLGVNNREYTTPQTARRMFEVFNRIYRTGQPVQVDDYEVFTKDGRRMIFELSAYLLRGQDGRPSGFAGVARDVTERWDAEQKIRESEARYRAIFENTGTAMTIIGKDTIMLMVNRKFEELSGYSKAEVEGKMSWTRVVHPDDLPRMKEFHSLRRKDRAAAPTQYEFRFVNRQGEIRQILLSIDMIPQSSESVASLLDITELKQAQARQSSLSRQLLQAQKMEAMGTLAGGIAHDFNNILQGISGLLQGLENKCRHVKDDACPHQQENFAKVFSLVNRGGQLIRGLLSFSRKGTTEFSEFGVNQVIQETEMIVRRTLPKEIALQVFLGAGPCLLWGSATQLQQVLLNLLTNARDALSAKRSGLISLKTGVRALNRGEADVLGLNPGEYLELEVADTGQGISQSDLPHIFDPFYTTKDVGQGTGLGLAVAYGIIKAHQGAIKCYSEPGVGTSFKLYLPLLKKDGDADRQDPYEVDDGQEAVSLEGRTILVVDDEDVIREVSVELLQGLGGTVLEAGDGQSALDVYRTQGRQIDFVLLDLGMPGLSGEETLQRLLSLDPGVRVVVASGYGNHRIALDPRRYGARAFIGKPYQFASLVQLIRRVLGED